MANIENMFIIYFMIGLVLFAGGAIDFNEFDVANAYVENEDGGLSVRENVTQSLGNINPQETSNPIFETAYSLISPLVLAWSLFSPILSVVFFPLNVMLSVNAPLVLVLGLGLLPTMLFIIAAADWVRGI